MDIHFERPSPMTGRGVSIELTGDEVATAIDAWLVAQGVTVSGPRTITVNGELCEKGKVFVDPSGRVQHRGMVFESKARKLCLFKDRRRGMTFAECRRIVDAYMKAEEKQKNELAPPLP